MPKPKILVFSTFYEPYIGGAEVALQETLWRLTEEFEFHVVTSRRSKNIPSYEVLNGIHVHRVGIGKSIDRDLFVLLGAHKAMKLHKKHRFSKSYVLMANWSAWSAMWFNRWTRNAPPSILNLQSGDTIKYVKKHIPFGFWWLYKKIYTSFDHITAISHFLKKRAMHFGAREGDITVIPNGVDIERYTKSLLDKKKLQALSSSINIPKKNKVVITTSRLVYKNNVENLIASMQYLPDEITLLILGAGDLDAKLKKQANQLNKDIRFLGHQPQKDIPYYLALSDVFVRPSFSEGLGCSFIEAMSMHLPIVATNVGGIPDFLIDNKTGLFCDPNDPQDIAEKIQSLLDDAAKYKTISTQGFKTSQGYSWDQIAAQVGRKLR